MVNPFDDFRNEVSKLLDKPNTLKIDKLTKEQKQELLYARDRGLAIEKICLLCQKHFDLKISPWTMRQFLKKELNNDSQI